MPTFVTIGYGDRAGYDQTEPSVRDAAHAHDERLRADGAVMGIAGQPVQVRNHDGAGVDTSEGPFLRSDLPVAGFALIEAATLEEAVNLASNTPCAVAHGVVELWPLKATPQGACATDWVDPEIEFVSADGPDPGSWTGPDEMAKAWSDQLKLYQQYRVIAEEFRELDHERVLVFTRNSGRGKISSAESGALGGRSAVLFDISDGKVARLALYWDRDHALADLGLAPEDAADRPN